MSEPHLDSLEIKNFRCFEHLTIEKLGRVNLIVGKNSVGKTVLLEGLWLLQSSFCWPVIHKILYDRNELVRYAPENSMAASEANMVDAHEQIEALKSFFSGRPPGKLTQIKGGGKGDCEALVFSFTTAQLITSHAISKDNFYFLIQPKHDSSSDWFRLRNIPTLPQKALLDHSIIDESKRFKTVYIPIAGLTWKATSTYWDDIALTDKEEDIISFLKVLDPTSKRFTFKGENIDNRVRYPVIKTDRFQEPVSLASMGEGIQRAFAMALAMSTASGGTLLIDEIEAGLYHQAQPNVWRAICKLAHKWNVQVFATTHSWDCVEAFQKAAVESDDEAMLIRLQKKKSGDGIVPVLYDKEDLTIVTEDNIEVR